MPWTLLSYAGSKLISILTTLVLARLIAPADFGILALATLATNFLTWIADMGFSGTVVLRQDLDRRGLGTLLTLMAITGVLAGLIAVAVAPLAALVFSTPKLTGVLAAVALLLPLGSVAGFWEALMQRELAFRRRFVAMIVQSLVMAVVSIPLAALGAGVWSLVVGQVAGMFALGLVLFALAPFHVRPVFDRKLAVSAFRTGRAFLGQGLAMYVRQNVDTVTVGLAFGDRRLGFYSMANRFGDLIYWTIAHPVGKVTFPAFARSSHAGDDIRPTFLRVLGMVALVSCPIGIIMSAAAEPFTRAVFGDRWLPMVGPLAIMGLWAAVRQMDQTIGWLLNSIDRPGALAWLSVFILIPLILGCWLAASIGGLTAVALVPLGDTILSGMISSLLIRRYLDLGLVRQWRAVAPAVSASIPTWLVTWGVGQLVDPARHAVIALILAVAAGALTYAGAVWLLAPAMLRQSVAQVGRMLGRGQPAAAPSS
ncbi:MAG TPA: oligosaccharide flippase family protein [Solirubrobacteraceae bacterium]